MEERHLKLLFGESGEKLCAKIFSLQRRFPRFFPETIIQEIGGFLSGCAGSFLDCRSQYLLCRILFSHHRLTKKLRKPLTQRIFLRFIEIEPSVFGIAIVLHGLKEYEIFNERHLLKRIQHLISGIKPIANSYFSSNSNDLHFFYLEIKKMRGGAFSKNEKEKLSHELPFELRQGIERVAPSLILPGNEEELFKNIQRLSKELKYVHDLPQVMISFAEHSQEMLKFLVIVLRVVKPETPSISVVSSQLSASLRFSLEKVLCIDKLRNKYPKEASVFTVEMNSALFLRDNCAVNLRTARQYIVKSLESMLGDFRDYNGGLLIKENEQLLAIKHALQKKGDRFFPLLEDLFYGIKPVSMRALISVEAGIALFELLQKTLNLKLESSGEYRLESVCSEQFHLAIIKTTNKKWKISFPQRILDCSSQIGCSCVESDSALYLCFFHLYPQSSLLIEAIHKELSRHLTSFCSQRKAILKLNFQAGDPPSLNPRCTDVHCHILCDLLFEGLTRINRTGEVEKAAADKIEISPCRTHYTFHLRPSRWSNGEEVTAYHFEMAWKRSIASDASFLSADFFSTIKNAENARRKRISLDQVGVHAKDDKTLCVALESPCPYFLNVVASPPFYPLYGESEEPTHFNGPFFLAEWNHDRSMYLSQNPFYRDAQNVKLEGIEIHMIQDPDVAYKMFQKGEIDLIGDPISPFSPEILKIPEASDHLICKEVSRIFWIHCNNFSYPLNNVNLRRALSLALNRKRLTDKVFIGQVPHHSLLPPKYSFNPGDPCGNPKEAQIYLEKALSELKISRKALPPFVLSHSDLSFEKPLFEELKSQWEENLGIRVQAREFSWNEFFAVFSRGDFQLAGLFRRNLFNDPMYYLSFFRKSFNNPFSWDNSEYEELLERFSREEDQREEILKKIERILIDEAPAIPLVNQRCFALINERVKGIDWNENGCLYLREAWIDETHPEDSNGSLSFFGDRRLPKPEKNSVAEEIYT